MNIKHLIVASMTSVFLLGGVNAGASPSPRVTADIQADVKVLSARIENAIAELIDNRTTENIKLATVLVMEGQDTSIGVKTAALNMVIQNAVIAGDQKVVGALKSIELETFDLSEEPEVRTDSEKSAIVKAKSAKSLISAPPAASANGGSDY